MEFIKLNIQLFAGDISDNEKLTSTAGNYGYLKASFEEVANSVNTNTNKNKVKAKATLTQKTGSWAQMYTPLLEIWWYDNNKNKSGVKVATTEVSKLSSGDVKTAEGTIEVEHLSDGSLKGYAKAKWLQKVNNGLIYEDGEVSTDNIPLTTIPRANTFKSVPDSANVGQGFTVTLNQKSTSFSTKLVCTCNGKSETIETTTDSAVFFLPKATFASAFGSNESKKTATITATTYNGTTQIGDPVTDTIVLHLLESDYEPVVSISAVDSNTTTKTLTGDATGRTCVLNASTMTCTVSAEAQNNATLSSVTINGASVATTTKTYTINNPTTNTFTIVAKDSRGFSNEAYDTLPNPISYFKPTVTANFKRNTPTDGKVKLTYSGKVFNQSFGAKSNECKFYYDYKLKSASSYTSVELKPTISGNTFSGSLTLPETYDYQQNYSFRLRVVDSLNTVVYAQDVAKGEPVFWWNEDLVNVLGSLTQKNLPVPFVKKSKNLFNKDYVVNNYRIASDGVNYAETGYFASNFIPIEPNTYYYVSHKDNGAYTRVAFYNINREFISADTNNNVAVLSPSNARYLRFSNLLTRLDLIQVEVGKKGTTYESYIEPQVYINRGEGEEIFPFSIAERLNNADLNMLVDKFTVAYGSNLLNAPINFGYVISIPVMNNKNYVRQFFVSNYDSDRLYMRCKANGTWSGWMSFAWVNDVYYKSGDTYKTTQQAIYTGGTVTSSTKSLNFTLTVPKKLTNVSKVNISSMTLLVRTTSGNYLNNASGGIIYGSTSGITYNTYITSENTILIQLVSTNAYTNVTNNTPVNVAVSNLNISFS